jgi:polyphosphate glucokinase
MHILVIDIGGTSVKLLASGQDEPRKFPSGPTLTPKQMVAGVTKLAEDWEYDVVSIGYPGIVVHNRPLADPHNLRHGWVGFNFEAAFHRPVRVINDAAMQALGSYKGGKMLFLGLGTGLGSTMIVDFDSGKTPTIRNPRVTRHEVYRTEILALRVRRTT